MAVFLRIVHDRIDVPILIVEFGTFENHRFSRRPEPAACVRLLNAGGFEHPRRPITLKLLGRFFRFPGGAMPRRPIEIFLYFGVSQCIPELIHIHRPCAKTALRHRGDLRIHLPLEGAVNIRKTWIAHIQTIPFLMTRSK